MDWKILCIFLLTYIRAVECQVKDVGVYINMAGVKGHIDFTAGGPSTTHALINLTGLEGWTGWEIREFPVTTTDADGCDDSVLGVRLHDLSTHESIGSVSPGTSVTMNGVAMLIGNNPIIGRSLLLTKGEQRACATIQGPEPVSYAVVKGSLAGNIHVRQVGTRFAVFTDLFNTNSLLDSSNSVLRIYNGTVDVDLPGVKKQVVDVGERCSKVAARSTLIAQFNSVPVAGGGKRRRSINYVTVNPLQFDFSSGSVLMGDNSGTSCANFHLYKSKTVRAVFSRNGVEGAITFTQDNPYKPTSMAVDLQNLQTKAGGYHVHEFPLAYQLKPETDLCGSAVTGGHFNPLSATNGNTQDEFEIGDLSGKHKSLAGLSSINKTYTDLYLPLFGEHSIVGRSIVIHEPSGARWLCANIEYPGPVIVAKAEFNGDVEGTITFVQEENKPWADTTVFIEMMDSGETNQATSNHNYHIHSNPVGEDYLSSEGRCSSTGGHWNPFDAPIRDKTIYTPTCAANRLGCEVGDLSSKYNETINMAAGASSSKYLYTDDIALSGAYSVIKRSITIHQQQRAAARYVCADIIKKITPRIKTAEEWHGTSNERLTGEILMSSSGIASSVASVEVSLNGLNQVAGGYHVHQYPLNVRRPGDNICGTTGGHYNPLGASGWKNGDTLDAFEIGDLSNKFGFLTDSSDYEGKVSAAGLVSMTPVSFVSTTSGKDHVSLVPGFMSDRGGHTNMRFGFGDTNCFIFFQFSDTNLPLSGAYSVAGRSVVIHESTGSRWKCANTVWDAQAMDGTLLQARAEFFGDIEGHITFSQVVSEEGQSDVNIEALLWYRDSGAPATTNHNWHVHVASVDGGDCATAKGHYNPFKAPVGSSEYSASCGPLRPRKCEYGDMSGKLSKLDIGTTASPTRYVFNDNFLSLNGKFPVIGRSIVIHAADSGAPRVACADIAPFGADTQVVVYHILKPTGAFKDDMAKAIADSVGADNSQVVYVSEGLTRGNCTAVEVYFTGNRAMELKASFEPSKLPEAYKKVDICNMGANGDNEIRASFSMAGIKGDIEFRATNGQRTQAIISINTTESLQWEVREFPIRTTDRNPCDDTNLGRVVKELTEFLPVIDEGTIQGSRIDLDGVSLMEGDDAILGRSLLLFNGNKRACATIQGPESLSFSVVKGPISGHIQVREVGTRFAVFTDLINTRSLNASSSSLRVYRGEVSVDLPQAQSRLVEVDERCSSATMTTMVGELKNVPIAAGGTSSKFFGYIERSITQKFDFSSGWLKVGNDAETSCANFHTYEPRTVRAVFNRDSVVGAITFTQGNPYKPTLMRVDLQNLQAMADGYHVHEFPLAYQFTTETDLCGPAVTGGHFNPLSAAKGDTQDEFEIGDLSGKHDSLAGLSSVNKTYTDLYLPLFGEHSIVGRSIVIHEPSGARWLCANIEYPGPVTVAKAEFNGDVEGTITFVQEENKPWADTTVFIEMMDSGETNQTTSNHNYHIHSNPVGEDYLSSEGRCSSTGGHWNPFNALIGDKTIYTPTCAANRLGCEVGDLSSKYNETINMAAGTSSSKYFYTDDIALSGAYSVIKRSITIHQQQRAAARYVCADIIKKLTPVITTENRWYGVDGSDTATGSIVMTSSGLNSHTASLNVDLAGLSKKAGGYHIHILPLNTLSHESNICGTTSGHYNPLVATTWKEDDSLDHYEIGDLSNKFDMLTDLETYKLQTVDTNLPLSGAYSVAGRSVVIHESKGSRWKCANTVWDAQAMNGTLVQARADFEGDIQGHITLSQVVSSEGESDVNMVVMLWNKDGQSSSSHNWHVHVSPVANKDCGSTGGHYNPFMKSPGKPSYKDCGPEKPRKCEVGDLSGKFGSINIGTKAAPTRYVFNDNFLSLTGKFGVMGRSIVIHAEGKGAPRVACADLTPFGPSVQVIQYYIRTITDFHEPNTQGSPSKVALVEAIKMQIDADEYHSVYLKTGMERGICTAVHVYFTGNQAEDYKKKFNANSLEAEYRPLDADSCNTATSQAYLSGLLMLPIIVLLGGVFH